jgi:hypothetical protein
MISHPKKSKPIAFDFVLDELCTADPVVRPMFGCHAIYVREKIVLILRKKEGPGKDNGVWVATTSTHHESLRKDFPSMRSISLFGGVESGWQNLPDEDDHFEEEVMKICKFILKGDSRIGKVPKPRARKSPNSKR